MQICRRVAFSAVVLFGSAAALCALPGCEGASAIGDVYDAAKDLVVAGKSVGFVNAPWDHALDAARAAANQVGLTFVSEEVHTEQRNLIYKDDRDQEVVITVVRRTETLTEVRVDVGIMGPQEMSDLVMKQVKKELPGSEAERATTGKTTVQE